MGKKTQGPSVCYDNYWSILCMTFLMHIVDLLGIYKLRAYASNLIQQCTGLSHIPDGRRLTIKHAICSKNHAMSTSCLSADSVWQFDNLLATSPVCLANKWWKNVWIAFAYGRTPVAVLLHHFSRHSGFGTSRPNVSRSGMASQTKASFQKSRVPIIV